MIRTVAGVGLGFLLLSAVMVGGTEGALESLGADNVFKVGVYDTTPIWKAAVLMIGLAAGISGGAMATIVGRRRSALVLAGLIGVLGVAETLLYMTFTGGDPGIRTESAAVDVLIINERKPTWLLAGNTVMSVAGVVGGTVGVGRARRALGATLAQRRPRWAHRKRATPAAPPAQIEC